MIRGLVDNRQAICCAIESIVMRDVGSLMSGNPTQKNPCMHCFEVVFVINILILNEISVIRL